MLCDVPGNYYPLETDERLTYLDLSFDKLKLLSANLALPSMEIKIRKNYLCLPDHSFAN